ncbi:copper homeostasis protein CutC [Phaeodactylibacter xiamenensis]|uniref:copper homeostasis protein CutC n=1 Tax=Phaeodactylibacter xiamenensis TaxID=1524460 RepID=UPI0024A9C24E|nr:copper homeostasis protein CutC [Phaeodactylibacter xiamenensis]
MEGIIREACVETLEQCRRAESLGADRLELCARLDLGGTTPDWQLVKEVLKQVQIPVKVMIRPRGGNFIYTEAEVAQMRASIARFLDLGVPEFVAGTLTPQHQIDLPLLTTLCEAMEGRPVTFHKAIDEVPDMEAAVGQLKAIPNLKYLLTSGGAPTAQTGLGQLRKLLKCAAPEITVIAAGSVTNANLQQLHQVLGGREYHGRKIVGEL